MRITNYTKVFRGLSGLSPGLRLASIMLIALLMASCGSTKQTSHSQSRETSDSLVIRETQKAIPVTVPESKAQIAIPTESLHKLPDGATFKEKSGQAAVEVKYIPAQTDTGEPEYIIVTATCDSLQLLCWEKEKELTRIRNDTENEKLEIKQDAAKAKYRCLIIGFICGACVIIVITISINKLKKYVRKE